MDGWAGLQGRQQVSCLLRHMTLVARFGSHCQLRKRLTYLVPKHTFPTLSSRTSSYALAWGSCSRLRRLRSWCMAHRGLRRRIGPVRRVSMVANDIVDVRRIAPFAHDTSVRELAELIYHQTGRTHFTSSRCALPGGRSAMSSTTSKSC